MHDKNDLSLVLITLLKGVVYKEDDERLWGELLALQPQARDYVAVLGLDLIVDEAEGYACLRSKTAEEDAVVEKRLVARRPLSFPVSLLIALLRKKLAELDAGGGETRLVLSLDAIVDMVRVFLPDSTNESRVVDQIQTHVNKIIELGFIRKMKTTSGPPLFEVRRILKVYVDAQWLADFDARLAAYRAQLAAPSGDADA